MRTAETVLGIIRERGTRGVPLEDVYRQLFNSALYLTAYGNLSANAGALTPGATVETVDGMSQAKIQAIIDALRQERYRWTPVRRIYIEKPHSTKKRPLGIPSWSDKLLQEVIRLILEAYYEPQFSKLSHGFRPNRGCRTALTEIYHKWNGTVWFIEGDISACFDSLDHTVILSILRENIHDNRFLRLVENLLKAGYLEQWDYHRTLSGVPQGGVVSPILSNIYLDRFDQYVEHTLIPAYTRGAKRKANPVYRMVANARARALRRHAEAETRALQQARQRLPSMLSDDPDYRRLRYLRYADDFLLGFAGPHAEAEAIKEAVGRYLRESLKLDLSETKTLITHGRTEFARFLGYDIGTMQQDTKHTDGRRSINGVITLRVPKRVIQQACAAHQRGGKAVHRPELLEDDPYTIVATYTAKYTGLLEYYRMAHNLHTFSQVKWVMETSLAKTLAAKFRMSVAAVYRRYSARYQGRRVLKVEVPRAGKPPLVAWWGTRDYVRRTPQRLEDNPGVIRFRGNELVKRLLADVCEHCGSPDQVEVHHLRHLKDVKQRGPRERSWWALQMATRRRKTLVLCHRCHLETHAGRLQPRTRVAGEPDASKGARPVRRGADGKVPAAT